MEITIEGLAGLTVGGFGLLTLFIQTYVAKKAEFAAQREDIGKITEIVKSIENKFETEMEILKAELTLYKGLQSNIYNEERSALVSLFEALHEYYQSVIIFNTTIQGRLITREEIYSRIDNRFQKYINSIYKLSLCQIFISLKDTQLMEKYLLISEKISAFTNIAQQYDFKCINSLDVIGDKIELYTVMGKLSEGHAKDAKAFSSEISKDIGDFARMINVHVKHQAQFNPDKIV